MKWFAYGGIFALIVFALLFTFARADALDPRCDQDRFKDKPICQTTTTSISTTTSSGPTTTTIPTTTTLPTTTTSTPTSTTTTSPGTISQIGVVGCSNTEDSIENPGAYQDQSSLDLLASTASGGGSLARWTTNSRNHWDIYDSQRPASGFDAVWWQLCVRTGEGLNRNFPTYEAQMDEVLTQIHARDPGVPVYVSWLNHYTFTACPQVDWAVETQLLDYAASLGLSEGPWLGPLTGTQVASDDCHPNAAGWTTLGSQLVEFFD